MNKRVERELQELSEGGLRAALVSSKRSDNDGLAVIYFDVPASGATKGLPSTTDVVVPVPDGYPASAIDLAGLPAGSPFLGRVLGDINHHGGLTTENQEWQLVSYHPHAGGGAPAWDPMIHGFHTYFTELAVWLNKLS